MNNNENSFFQVINNKFLLKNIFYWVNYINTIQYHCISLRYNEIDSIEWMIENNHKSLLYYKIKSNYKNLIFNKNSIQQLFKLIYQDSLGGGGGDIDGDSMIEIIYSNYFNSHLKYYDMVTLLSNDNSNIGALKMLWKKYPDYPCNSLSVDNCIYNGQLIILDYLLSKCCKYTESRLVGNAIQSSNRNLTMKYLIEKKLLVNGNGCDHHHHHHNNNSHNNHNHHHKSHSHGNHNSVVQIFSQLDLKLLESNMYEFEYLVIQYFESIGLFNQSSKSIYKNSNPILLFKKKQKLSNRGGGNGGVIPLKIIDEYNNLYSTIQIFIFYQKKFNGIDYNSDLNLGDFQNYSHSNQSTTSIPIPPDSTLLEQFKRLYILFIKVILLSNNKHEMFNEEDVYMMVSKFSIQYNDITQLKSNLPLGKAYRDKFRFSRLFEMCIEYCNSDILLELIKQYSGNDYSFFSFSIGDRLYAKPMKARLIKSTNKLEIQESRKETLSFFERLLSHYTTNVKYSSENFKRKSYTGIPKVSSVDGSYVIATSTLSSSNASISSNNSSSTTTTPLTTPCALIGDQDNLITVIVSIFNSLVSYYPLEDIESAFKLMVDYEIGDYVDAFGTLKLSKNAASFAAQRGNFSIFQFIYNNRSKFYWDENVFKYSLGNKNSDIVSFILNHMEHIINYSTALDTATIYCNPEIISILINHESSRNNHKSFQCCETSFMRALRTNNTVFKYLFYHCQDEQIPQSISNYINNHYLLSLFINLPSEYYDQHKERFTKSINEINSMKRDLNFLSDYYFPLQYLKIINGDDHSGSICSTMVTSNHLINLFSKNQFKQVIKPILKLVYPNNSFINSSNRNNSMKLLFKNLIQKNQLSIFKKLFKHFNYLFIQPSSASPNSSNSMDNNLEINNWYNIFIKSLPMIALENNDYNIFNFLALECGIANDVESLNPVSLLNVIQNCPLSFIDHLFSCYQFSKLISIIISDIISSQSQSQSPPLSTTLPTSTSSQQIVNSNSIHEITIENDNINLLSNSKIPNIKYIYCKYLNNSNNTNNNDSNNSNSTSTLFTLKKSFSKIFKSSKKLK